ncbi:TIGR03086 family metal-binding protein [Micromonospora deserti]|uniref:TIGR03086 family protein n=1 Tax=Micromonospora deserti TaxID=2070366 RepID=A0A2W2C9R3_9ACTN|nr:TIGR03086 family metal-binding protein [Micromonospora deserti]PZF96071.1 TIGR03086 family protein [Micromonospora deserti]
MSTVKSGQAAGGSGSGQGLTAEERAVADRFARLGVQFADRVAAVPAGGWSDPTPCTEWSVRDLVAHVVEMSEIHLSLVGLPVPQGPGVDVDPYKAFVRVRDQIEASLNDPEQARAEWDGRFGLRSFAEAIDSAVCTELVVHGWDLARATGQDERIDQADVDKCWEALRMVGEEVVRSRMVSGPALEPPAGADEQTRLLAYLGRRA